MLAWNCLINDLLSNLWKVHIQNCCIKFKSKFVPSLYLTDLEWCWQGRSIHEIQMQQNDVAPIYSPWRIPVPPANNYPIPCMDSFSLECKQSFHWSFPCDIIPLASKTTLIGEGKLTSYSHGKLHPIFWVLLTL